MTLSSTRDPLCVMDQVSVRELRNHAGDVLDRVEAGERLTVTRNGKPVAAPPLSHLSSARIEPTAVR